MPKTVSLTFIFSMRFLFFFLCTAFVSMSVFGQKTIAKTLRQFNNGSVPYITVNELKKNTNYLLLDTRKKEEYRVSHIKNAKWAGYKKFELDSVLATYPDKNTPIVVYCSIGVRSENIGEKLQRAGYTNVKNLYGGIFEWKNNKESVVDPSGHVTEKVHAFNKQWGKLLIHGEKVFTDKFKKLETEH